MQNDGLNPVNFHITINGSSFTGSAPADGFIDPTTLSNYLKLQVSEGSTTSPTVNNGDSVKINGIPVTFTTGYLNLAGIVAAINLTTNQHHVVASVSGSNIALTNQTLYENFGIQLADITPGIVAVLGFVTPTITFANTGYTTLALSQAKQRANSRWNTLVKELNFIANTIGLGDVNITGANLNTQGTEIDFLVSYQNMSVVYTYDELNNNALLTDVAALQRVVARVLCETRIETVPVFNPTLDSVHNFQIGYQVQNLTIGALAADIPTANATITVVPVPSVIY